ncbi:MAG: FAD-binding protein [Selenomonadaceae bacterium]|nr:FAD-binding protein [Selenomonadaceae bacterium]MDY2685701.1 FAD-binding protein [Selenomonadaceae bacterium]
MLRIHQFAVPFHTERSLAQLVAERISVREEQVAAIHIVRKAVDARRYHGAPILFVYDLDVSLHVPEKKVLSRLRHDKHVSKAPVEAVLQLPKCSLSPGEKRPVVVGFGPAGMFAALTLAKAGRQPIVLERGEDVDTRHQKIQTFWHGGALDTESNVQFGEGGAGTFSDGKLTARHGDPLMREVLDAFVQAGAPEEIRYLRKPHIGTDLLRGIVKNIRMEIQRLGGEVRFSAKATDFEMGGAGISAVRVNGEQRLETDAVFLGIGHSARDTYRMLYEKGIAMEAKAFAMGVRIEHPQEWIDRRQYGEDAGSPLLPVADYALTYQDPVTRRGAYTFCMCPGGQVVAAASQSGGVVTNGMSNYRRDSGIANSAVLVQVRPEDYHAYGGVLGGMLLQEKIEHLAFLVGGGDYRAPVQKVGDFLQGRSGSTDFLLKPTYEPGVRAADLHACLPDFLTDTLAGALPFFDRKIPGFADPRVVMTGVESRSSAPCRILRSRETMEAVRTPGLYPMGEGAGYAGGIMSAAVDGIKAALSWLRSQEPDFDKKVEKG